jgi:hypothetical protein
MASGIRIFTTVPIEGLENHRNIFPMVHLDMRDHEDIGAFEQGRFLARVMRERAAGERAVIIKEFGDGSGLWAGNRVLIKEPNYQAFNPKAPLGQGLLAMLPADPIGGVRQYLVAMHEGGMGGTLSEDGTLRWLMEAATGYRFEGGPVLDFLMTEYEGTVGHSPSHVLGGRGWDENIGSFRAVCRLHPATKRFTEAKPDGDDWRIGMRTHREACDLMNRYSAAFRASLIGYILHVSGWTQLSMARGNYQDADHVVKRPATRTSGLEAVSIEEISPEDPWFDRSKMRLHGLPVRRRTPHGMGYGAGWAGMPDCYLNDTDHLRPDSSTPWRERALSAATRGKGDDTHRGVRMPVIAPPEWAGDPVMTPEGQVLSEKPEASFSQWVRDSRIIAGSKSERASWGGRCVLWSNGRRRNDLGDGDPQHAGTVTDKGLAAIKELAG